MARLPRHPPRPAPAEGPVALLGPTNTGKTHRAIESMLTHRSGMIGLPLRLLAREVYDRVTAAVGERAVALVTGEEKRVPAEPRYFVCTVEAMPVSRAVDFLAVDEIQLCAHPDRGHVFTDRLLHARGRRRTMFLGADTIGPLLRQLVPDVRVERHERFSRLTHAGPQRLSTLPPRSAVVAYTVADVYELAEQVRARHGGTAIVLGALSPRTRNAQVAMYQAGEVQHMVATDAIGMGLNLDVELVTFAGLSKFDGHEHRPLDDAELAQVAGRAGRYRRDGRFGPLRRLGPLPTRTVEAIEHHRFAALRQLVWRNPDLELDTLDGLLASLARAAPRRCLRSMQHASDQRALAELSRRPSIRERVVDRAALRTLWAVCGVPDYRRELGDAHADLLERIFTQLVGPRGRIDDDFLAAEVERLDRTAGDIETLTSRIAHIRTWTYAAHADGWVADAAHWQGRTRAIEDRLSDALHERLTERFVDRTALLLLGPIGGRDDGELRVDDSGVARLGERVLGRMVGFRFLPAPGVGGDRTVEKAVRRRLEPELAARVERCVDAAGDAFALDADARVRWDGDALAQLSRGHDPLTPRLRMGRLDLLGAGARARIERRLQAWVRDVAAGLVAPLRRPPADGLSPPARGLLYLLEQGLGTLETTAAREQLDGLTRADRKRLAALDVRIGTQFVYVASLLGGEAVALRGGLAALFFELSPAPSPPRDGAPSAPAIDDAPAAVYRAMGYPLLGGRAVRVDLVERLAAVARQRLRRGPFPLPGEASAWLDCSRAELRRMLEELGYRERRGADGRPRFHRARRSTRRGPRR